MLINYVNWKYYIRSNSRSEGYGVFSHCHYFSLVLKHRERRAFSKCYTILHTRLQSMWIGSVLGHSFPSSKLLWPCSLIETSDTELKGQCQGIAHVRSHARVTSKHKLTVGEVDLSISQLFSLLLHSVSPNQVLLVTNQVSCLG